MRLFLILCVFVMLTVFPLAAPAENRDIRNILIEDFQLEDNEALDAFIALYQISPDNLTDLNVYYLYDSFLKQEPGAYSIESLLYPADDMRTDAAALRTADDIRRILVIGNWGNAIQVVVFDKEEGTVYTGDGRCLYSMRDALRQPLSSADIEDVMAICEKYDVFSWESRYVSPTQEYSVAWFSWLLAFETVEGRNISFEGSGSGITGYPVNAGLAIQELLNLR